MLCGEGLQYFDVENQNIQTFNKWSEIHYLTFSPGPKHYISEKLDTQI